MKIQTRLSGVFLVMEALLLIALSAALFGVVRSAVHRMVARESREMVTAISGTLELLDAERDFDRMRSYVLERRIGQTGFYFVLGPDGTYLVHPNEKVEGQNWAGREAFIDYILEHRQAPEAQRSHRYVSPQTGQWKQVYFEYLPGPGWTVVSSAWEHEIYTPLWRIVQVSLIVVALGLLVTMGASIFIGRRIGRSFRLVAQGLERLSRGDLSVQLEPDRYSEETILAVESLNGAVSTRFRPSMQGIQRAVESTRNVESELASATQETSMAMNQIAATIASIRDRMTQLDRSIDTNASVVGEITTAVGHVGAQIDEENAMVEESTASVHQMIDSLTRMERLLQERETASRGLAETAEAGTTRLGNAYGLFSEEIASRIDVIQDAVRSIRGIASQTNLLAMNAAIEAAHAGDAGRGFSVVAAEIRALAEDSARSSSHIASALKEVINGIEETGKAMREVTAAFSGLVQESRATAESLSSIGSNARELTSGGNEILTAMTVLQNASTAIHDRSSEVQERIQSIAATEAGLKDASRETNNGIAEIMVGIEEINRAMNDLNERNLELRSAIDGIVEGMSVFSI